MDSFSLQKWKVNACCLWSGYKVFEFTNIQPCLRDKHDLRPHHTTQKNYRSHTIARVRDIARVNCRTYTYFFPKQNVIIITQTFLDLQISLFKIIIIFGWKFCILIQITIWDRILIFFQIFTESNLYGSSHLKCSVRKGVLRSFAKFTGKHLCQTLFWQSCRPDACNFIKKETLAPVFTCEYCGISKNTFFYRTPQVDASVGMTYSKRLDSRKDLHSVNSAWSILHAKFKACFLTHYRAETAV